MADIEEIKEQVLDRIDYGTDIKLFSDIWELLRDHPNVVRCKDCKHGYPLTDSAYYQCTLAFRTSERHERDWFCADGERK